jgi:hypothetical protein
MHRVAALPGGMQASSHNKQHPSFDGGRPPRKEPNPMSTRITARRAPVTLAAALACISLGAAAQSGPSNLVGYHPGGAAPTTGNNSPAVDWRVTQGATFNGVSFEGNARLRFDNDGNLGNGSYVCSGTLLAGGQYVLTAAHCADDFNVMEISFGVYNNVATQTRGVSQAYVHPGWTGDLSGGSDIAVLRLDAPVTTIQGFNISRSTAVGQQHLIMGYGSTSVGNSSTATGWSDWGWAHYGYNTFDVTAKVFDDAWDGSGNNQYGEVYVVDFDSLTNGTTHNTLQRVADLRGNAWSSGLTLGNTEALIAGGDSGGGDFVWNGSEWLLAGVHSWGWQFCGGRISPTCDFSSSNSSSWGDLSGSTAVFSHAAWIESITGPIPEPGTYGLMALGLAVVGVAARRRKAA